MSPPPRGSSRRPPSGWRTWPTCSPTTTATALDLARAAGEADRAAELEAPARRFLTLAGERALGLDTTAALANLERALALTPPTHPGRPDALVRFAEAAFHAGRTLEAKEALEQATHRSRSAAISPPWRTPCTCWPASSPAWPIHAGSSCRPRRWRCWNRSRRAARSRGADGGCACGLPPRQSETALASAQRAVALADELGLERSPRTLGYLGFARGRSGDPRGLDDMREAIRIATDVGQGREVGVLHNNLGLQLWAYEGPQAALDELDTGTAFAPPAGSPRSST